METMKGASKSLRRELEEERANLQEKLARWESERVALKRGLTEAKNSRKQLESAVRLDSRGQQRERTETRASENTGMEFPPPPYEEACAPRPRVPVTRSSSTNIAFQFAHTDHYPPFLESIPRKLQTPPDEIFNFTSLVQTTAMIFVNPNLLPNIRNRAPDLASTRTMQDLVDRNLRLHTASRQSRSRDMYSSVNIGLRDDWYTDAVFGQQQFTGTNPTSITLASARWIEEFKAVSSTQQRTDVTRLLTEDPENLFVQDYSYFRSVMGVLPTEEFGLEGRYGCSSVVLFRLEPEGRLHPLAITLDYKGSMEASVTIFNRRITSSTPGEESTDWLWRYAKMCAQVSDWLRHEVSVHLVNTHLVEEVLIVAAYRTFDPSHVVFNLLEPHWKTTLSLNQAARLTLVPKIIIPLTGFTPAQSYAYIKDTYKSWDWVGSYVPNDLNKRGFPVEDLDKPKYHKYGYARNIVRIWDIIRKFVSTVLREAYVGGDAQVANDMSIASFCSDVRANDGGQLASFPNIRTLDELIDFVTMGIHVASPQHTAVNYLQQYYQTFIPNKPSALYSRLPQSLGELESFGEGDVLSALPIDRPKDWLVMAQVPYLLSFEVPDDSTILHYATTMSSTSSNRQSIRKAASVLRDDLEAFSRTVSELNIDIGDHQTPYYVLDPKRTAVSILI
ncbi:Lipoxygenase [Dendrothele bispora CBS 962.96]|uniref:Manganese lipoxygenase n=1 Tax=Dendrothele bispora (strain CBS 962.96) TaxID=1314807 RepID=A0A4S8M5S9_DENBC|nr:Lipoxygenase [Dendrothele bispora CBS 962.96]